MTTEKLRACPFCGGAEIIITRETHRPPPELCETDNGGYRAVPRPSVMDGWIAECRQCGARGPHEYTNPVQSIERAAYAWNARPLESALEARVKELETERDEALLRWANKKNDLHLTEHYAKELECKLKELQAEIEEKQRA